MPVGGTFRELAKVVRPITNAGTVRAALWPLERMLR